MQAIRPAAVAGAFYPGDPAALAAEVAAYLAQAGRPAPVEGLPKAVIAPHAGYMYSGPVAGVAYARIAPLRGRITRVVLAGPAHRVYVAGVAVPAADSFASPLGPVRLDRAAIERLRRLPFVELSDRAHAHEHSLEVHLPFLQSVLGDFGLVPLVVGGASPQEMAELFEAAWGGEETLVVVSSDLSHYLPYEAARRMDRATAEAIVALEPVDPEQACGAAPINGLLAYARRHGLRAELLDLRNSGDTQGGRERVVGYGAFALREAEKARA